MTANDPYWNEKAKNLMDAWAKSQVQFWENWLGDRESIPASIPATKVKVEPVEETKEAGEKILDKEVVLRFLELSQVAWKDLLALAASYQNRAEVELANSDRFKQFSIPAPTSKTTRDAAELWLMYLKGLQKWGQFAAASGLPSLPAAPPKSDRPELTDLASLYQNFFQNSLTGFLTAGMPGASLGANKQLLQGYYAGIAMYKATLEYQLAIAEIWTRTLESMI